MACQEVITNVPPVGQAKPASRHNGGGFVRFENCGSWDFWIHDVNANCNSIYNLAKINCIPLIDFLTTPLQVDVDANGHTIYNVGKILIGSSTDDGSGALLQVAGEINAQSYMLGGFEFASYATPGQVDLTNIYSINGVTGFLPAGVEGSIQFNDDGNLSGDSFLVYDENTHNVGIVPLGLGPQWRLDVGGDINIIDPTYLGYAYRINGIPFAIADAGGSHINLVNIGLINGAPPGSGGTGATPGGQPGNIQFNVTGGLFGGSNNLFWDNVNNRLGIGTAAPAYPLDVVGNENITGCYYIAQVPFACQSGSGIALQNIVTINGGPPGGAATLPGGGNGNIQFNNSGAFGGSNNLTWDNTNNRLGVGTFAPGYPLDVVGNVNARGCYLISGLTFACSDGAGGINLTNITNINGNPPGTGGGGASVSVGDTPPSNPQVGNLWFDSVGTQLYIWYTDPTSSQWVATINQCSGSSGGGGAETVPGLPLNSVQWNNNNTFAGSANMLWQDSVSTLAINGIVQTATLSAPVGSGLTVNALNLVTFNVSGNQPLLITSTAATVTYSLQIKTSNNTFSPNLVFNNSANEQWTIEEDAQLLGTGGLRFLHYLSPTPNTELACILPNGNVGIGTPTPAYTLDVNSAANAYVSRFTNSGTFSGIIIDHTQTSGGESVVSFRSGGTETAVIEYDSDEDNLIFWTGARDAANSTLCCTGNSNVGIMTTSPATTLDVNGTGRFMGNVNPTSGVGIEISYGSNTGAIYAYDRDTASWEQLSLGGNPIFLNSGNQGFVGIGTATPSYSLDVTGDVNITGVYRINGVPLSTGAPQTPWASNINAASYELNNVYGITGYAGLVQCIATTGNTSATDTQLVCREQSNNQLYGLYCGLINVGHWVGSIQAIENSAGTQLLLNPSGGNVSVRSTADPGASLGVWSTTGNYFFKLIDSSTGNQAFFTLDGGGNLGVGQTFTRVQIKIAGEAGIGIGGNAPAGEQLYLSQDSAFKPATNTWTIISDIRTKANLNRFEGDIEVIRRLNPIVAEYNGLAGTPAGSRVVSLDPEELREIVPQCVSSTRRKLRETDAEETEVLGVNTHEIFYYMLRAIQQLDARLSKFEAI